MPAAKTQSKTTRKKKDSGLLGFLIRCIGAKATGYIVLLLILFVLIGGVMLGFHTNKFIGSNTTSFDLKAIGELATQAGYYTNVEVIEDSKKVWSVTLPFTSSQYIFSYDGIIKAGLDFKKVEWSVNDIAKTISVKLPEARILSNEIDNDSLYVYNEERNIFSPLTVEDLNTSQIAMKQKSEEKAIGNGILDEAVSNAQLLITGFFAGGYPEYEVTFE